MPTRRPPYPPEFRLEAVRTRFEIDDVLVL
jgi:transposase-like protein